MRFQYVEEQDDFLALFPHRFDYLYAKVPHAYESPAWQTESRFPLSDRMIQKGGYLFGVRFGTKTKYVLLDIDTNSLYHPKNDSLAISRIIAALEEIGLVAYVGCTSSYTNGLHLYFPFQETQSSWEVAFAVSTLLENSGFRLRPGQLELFPNPKAYIPESCPTLFNGHRLPLQIGSYLVNQDFQTVWSGQDNFVKQWHQAAARNDLSTLDLKKVINQNSQRCSRVSNKAEKFINDLNAEIDLGWTGYGQTNRLLGRITMRTYIFGHLINGGDPFRGDRLIDEVVRVAESLSGYREWCRHQHEIRQRAEEWARCIERSHYFAYGNQKGKYELGKRNRVSKQSIKSVPTYKEQQSQSAREKIRLAIADLLEKDSLPAEATIRFNILTKEYRIGGSTLYKYRDLWHPNHLREPMSLSTQPDQPDQVTQEAANYLQSSTSLFTVDRRNVVLYKLSTDFSDNYSEKPPSNCIATTSVCPEILAAVSCSSESSLVDAQFFSSSSIKEQISQFLCCWDFSCFEVELVKLSSEYVRFGCYACLSLLEVAFGSFPSFVNQFCARIVSDSS